MTLYAIWYNPYRSTLGGLGWKVWAMGYTLAEARAKIAELKRDCSKDVPWEARPQR